VNSMTENPQSVEQCNAKKTDWILGFGNLTFPCVRAQGHKGLHEFVRRWRK